MIFETDRLIIKRLSIANLNNFHKIHGDPEVMGQIPAPVCSVEESTAKLVSIIEAYERHEHRLRIWGAFLKQSDDLIGISAAIRLSDQCRDIGYRIRKEYWGQGFGTEVATGLITYLRSDHSIHYLTASVDQHNIASIKILDKNMTLLKEEYDVETNRFERHYKLIF